MHSPSSPLIIEGYGPIGMAVRKHDRGFHRGIYVRNRLNNTRRLFFDLYARNPQMPAALESIEDLPLSRSIEFSIADEDVTFPDKIGILMSRRSWLQTACFADTLTRNPWLNLDTYLNVIRQSYSSTQWGNKWVDVSGVVLGSPTFSSTTSSLPGQWQLQAYLGLVDSEDELCKISRGCLRRCGELVGLDHGTCFFLKPASH